MVCRWKLESLRGALSCDCRNPGRLKHCFYKHTLYMQYHHRHCNEDKRRQLQHIYIQLCSYDLCRQWLCAIITKWPWDHPKEIKEPKAAQIEREACVHMDANIVLVFFLHMILPQSWWLYSFPALVQKTSQQRLTKTYFTHKTSFQEVQMDLEKIIWRQYFRLRWRNFAVNTCSSLTAVWIITFHSCRIWLNVR